MDYKEFKNRYNVELNEQQEQAVQTINGPCLLLAVPGSGKTTVLVTRLGYMIYGLGIKPENILTITYTVAATKDMEQRFLSRFGDEFKDRLEFRTINGISAKIIHFFCKQIGKQSFELEADEKIRMRRLTALYSKITGDYPAESDIRDISTRITFIKNMMLTDKEIDGYGKDVSYPLKDIYEAYNRSLKEEGKMDYDDQMVYALTILKTSPPTLSYFQDCFQYICVDEAQDTSKVQHELIRILAAKNDNLFMVGDEDQSIYGFRAAYPEALLKFEKEHKGAKVLLMEENFRSTVNIVEAADAFIQKNVLRHKKTLRAHRERGTGITRVQVKGRSGQYLHILNMAKTCETETAVLYRDNESVLPLVDLFDRNGIPFRIKNAELSFFTHRVVMDIIHIIQFALNPSDTDLFRSIYYKLNLYITRDDVQQICANSEELGCSILEAGQKYKFAKDGLHDRFKDFVSDIGNLKTKKPGEAVQYIADFMGYRKYLQSNHISDGKLAILIELFRQCDHLEDALKRLEELKEMISIKSATGTEKIIFSTIHSSKGLEYDTVYLLDVIDGIFPEKAYVTTANLKEDELSEYEELRRIFYVGATRAKNRLFLFRTGLPSQFIDEFRAVRKKEPGKPVLRLAYEDYLKNLRVGRFVRHKKFGDGVVTSVNVPFVSISFGAVTKTFGIDILYKNGILVFL